MPKPVLITRVWIDPTGRLCARTAEAFEDVYRAAMEVHWDREGGFLYSPPPREWTYGRWMQQFRDAVRAEYDQDLVVDASTDWDGVGEATKQELGRGLADA